MRNTLIRILAPSLLAAFVTLSSPAHSEVRVIVANPDEPITIPLSAGDIGLTKVTVLVPAPTGYQPETTRISFDGPDGTRLRATYKVIASISELSTATADTAFPTKLMLGSTGSKKREEISLPYASTPASAGSAGGMCGGKIPKSLFAFYQNYVSQFLGHLASEAEVCAALFGGSAGGGGGGTTSSSNTVDLVGLLLKNPCGSASSRSVLKLDIATDKIAQSVFTNRSQIDLKVNFADYIGGKHMKLKAALSGRIHGPGILAEHISLGISSSGGDYAIVGRWKGNKLASSNKHDWGKSTYYHSWYLGVAGIGSELKGGKIAIYVASGDAAYGECFDAVAKDQYKNGYSN